jgi:hypothetical protein
MMMIMLMMIVKKMIDHDATCLDATLKLCRVCQQCRMLIHNEA